jgi:hypothetical protein
LTSKLTSTTTSNSLNKTITSTQTTPIYDILNTG